VGRRPPLPRYCANVADGGRSWCVRRLPAAFDVVDRAVGFADGGVDVLHHRTAQPACLRIVLFACDVVPRLAQEFRGMMQAAAMVEVGVARRAIGQVLAVLGGGPLGFVDSLVDLRSARCALGPRTSPGRCRPP